MSLVTLEQMMRLHKLRFLSSFHAERGMFIVILQTMTWEESWVGRAASLDEAFQDAYRAFRKDRGL